MEKLHLQNNHIIKLLTIDDIEIIESLCIKCSDYYILHDRMLPSV
jgi:hypothetical protein